MATALPKSRQWKLGTLAILPYDVDVANNLSVAGVVSFANPVAASFATTITAGTTQTQAGATLLAKGYNNVTTVGTAQDGVRLPVAVVGTKITVRNSGANIVKVYPFLGATIDGLAVNLGVSLAVGSEASFIAKTTTAWVSDTVSVTLVAPTTQTGTLVIKATASAGETATTITNASQAAARVYSIPDAGADANFVMSQGAATIAGVKTFSGMPKFPVNTPVAGAGTVIGDAAPVLTGITVITGANGTVGWLLPVTTGGDMVILKGTTAGVAKLWPQSGAQINAVGASTAMSLTTGAIPVILVSTSATQWYTLPLVPS